MRLEYFQLVDRIAELDLSARTVRVEACVPETSTIFEGHFPGHPLMPGVLLIETMAQTSGWLLIGIYRFERMPFLAAVKEAKLRTFIGPGAQLTVSATVLHEGSGFAVTRASIEHNGKIACQAELTFRAAPFPDPAMRTTMQQLAERIGFPMGAMVDG